MVNMEYTVFMALYYYRNGRYDKLTQQENI